MDVDGLDARTWYQACGSIPTCVIRRREIDDDDYYYGNRLVLSIALDDMHRNRRQAEGLIFGVVWREPHRRKSRRHPVFEMLVDDVNLRLPRLQTEKTWSKIYG